MYFNFSETTLQFDVLKKLQAEENGQVERVLFSETGPVGKVNEVPKLMMSEAQAIKYEPSLYGYLRLNGNLTTEHQAVIIDFLYDLLKELFYNECPFKKFEAIFL